MRFVWIIRPPGDSFWDVVAGVGLVGVVAGVVTLAPGFVLVGGILLWLGCRR